MVPLEPETPEMCCNLTVNLKTDTGLLDSLAFGSSTATTYVKVGWHTSE